ncbi:hypothetical protein HK097_004696 [Rhizophlyctis rosea]|uniref:Uncharacterized protein n=1 Tax=Rhizophlyctis rosea TaxID=64517 RepID=A0AAD5SG04_9FUNG|nr:hypothetical protein HK097_004696 [Rhizophlyctis rosea]
MSARVGPDGGPGAEDFHLMVDKLSTKGLSREDLDVNAEAVAHWVLAMLVARFEVLEAYLARAGSGATPYNFLMMQILPETLLPHDNDPINSHAGEDLFATLTEILRHAEAGALRNRIFECLRLFRRRFPDEKVPVVIDEVQILLAESTEFYAGTNNTEQSRPLYTPVVRTVLDVGGKSVLMPVVVSGTGLSVTNAEEKSGSMIAKGVSTTERVVCRSGQVFTAFEEYVDHFMDLGGDGAAGRWSRMWSLLRGRPRFAATFIETCLTTLNHMADSSGSLHEVLNEVTFQLLRHDNNKSLYAAVRRLHQSRKPELWNFAVNACASYIYTGSSIVFYREEHLELIEIGVGQLDRGRRAGSLEGRIDEPLVAMAMSRFCEDHDTPLSERVFQWMGVAKHNPSGNGFLWETVLPTELRRLFDGTRPMKDHPLFKTFSSLPTYFQYPATICPPVETTSLYGSQSLKAGDTYRLHHFLRKPLAPFLLPEFEAGPDIAFAVKFQSTPPITIACFLQAKLAVKVGNKRAAKSTTCPERFFSRKGRGGLVQKRQDVMATLREGYNREMGVIRITLAYPAKIGAAKVVSTSYPQRITRSRARGIATHPDVELLVDATNIQLFATEQHIKFLENLKGEDLEQRDVEEEVGSSDDDGVDTEEQYVSDAMDVDE